MSKEEHSNNNHSNNNNNNNHSSSNNNHSNNNNNNNHSSSNNNHSNNNNNSHVEDYDDRYVCHIRDRDLDHHSNIAATSQYYYYCIQYWTIIQVDFKLISQVRGTCSSQLQSLKMMCLSVTSEVLRGWPHLQSHPRRWTVEFNVRVEQYNDATSWNSVTNQKDYSFRNSNEKCSCRYLDVDSTYTTLAQFWMGTHCGFWRSHWR